ncbi:MAG: hypothetical protein IKK84_02470 [Clostridia bacterium]|nr:hypothetical protein [Clostridia bacterium]MBR6640606.1 hypothetical protein [Clostridia bacterium]
MEKKEKKMPKEYAAIVSLCIFFTIVTIVGGVRLFFVISAKNTKVDLENIDIIEQNTNLDINRMNLAISNTVEEQYGVDIYYGEGVNAASVNATNITDKSEIFSMLRAITSALTKYPEDIIREIESKGYMVSIHLVDKFTNNIEALANRNSIGHFNIYISNSIEIERAFHHEFYHILDYYIKLETAERYAMWNKYNPHGFKYSNNVNSLTTKYVYSGQSGAHFVTAYAKYSEKEDRAETFAEMMTANKMETFFNEGEHIKSKMNLIIKVLNSSFESVRKKETLAWE